MTALVEFSALLAQATVPDERAQMLRMFGTMAFVAIAMYVLMFRPQQKKAREHADMLKTVKSGDRIATSGGILGVVVSVKEKSLSIRSADTKLEVLKSSVSEIMEKGAAES